MINLGSDSNNSKDVTYHMVKILAKQKSGLKLCHINAQSLMCKIDEFRLTFEESNIDVVCVSETWLNESIPDSLISLHGYKVFRFDRIRRGGGVAVFIKNSIKCKLQCKSGECDNIEYVFVEISKSSSKMLVGCVYRPRRDVPYADFFSKLEILTMRYNNVCILGDFNSNVLRESSLKDNMGAIGLIPINTTVPTHFTTTCSSLIDLIFVENSSNVLFYDQIAAPCFSKHDLIFLTYDFHFRHENQVFLYRDFKNIDFNLLYETFYSLNWDYSYLLSSANDQLNNLESNISTLFDSSVPIKQKKITTKRKPWFTVEILQAIKNRDLAYSRWKRFRTMSLKTAFCIARRDVNNKIRMSKSKFYSNKFSAAVGSKNTWKIIQDIGIGRNGYNSSCTFDADELNKTFTNFPTNSADVSGIQNDFDNVDPGFNQTPFEFSCVDQADVISSFVSIKSNAVGFDNMHPKFIRIILPLILPFITRLFNTIITTSTFPDKWKYAKIIPVPKSNTEYRPISILSFLSKAFEKLLCAQMTTYINENNLLTCKQSGFRTQHSCVTALAEVTENIRRDLDNRKVNFLVLLDHSKAFDTVNHQILFMKLKNLFNFSRTATSILSSYLTSRIQSVYVNNTISTPIAVSRGVPQGSILGPLLFSIYANDLPQQLQHCNIQMYADDVQVYLSSPVSSVAENVEKLNNDLNRIYRWADRNGLCLNPQKSKCMIIQRRSQHITGFNVLINNQYIEIVQKVKNLGIVFNNNLTWSSHIDALVIQTYQKLRSLWATQYFTPLNVRKLLAKSYLIPGLLYGCELFGKCDSTSKRKLNVLYNNIIRYVYRLQRHERVSSFSKCLYGVSFENLLNIKILMFLHKIITSEVPPCLFNMIHFTRSLRGKRLITPVHRCLISEWQFFINAARLWNSLPPNIQQVSNATQFKKNLFNFFNK